MSDLTWALNFGSIPYAPGTQGPPADTSVIIKSGTVHLGSFGSIGNGKFSTAEALQMAQWKQQLDDGLANALRRGLVTLQVTVNGYPIFTGALDTTQSLLGSNVYEFDGRDNCFILQERNVDPHVAPNDQTIQAFITTLIKSAGLGILNIAQPYNPSGTPITMGTYYGTGKGKSHFFSRPEAVWGTIQRIAKDCGFVAYCNSQGQFYFGPRNRGQASGGGVPTKALTWSANGPSDFLHGGLHIHHEGQRHSAFIVVVNSSNKKNENPVVGTCEYVNPQLALDLSHTLAPSGVPGVPPLPKSAASQVGMFVGISVSETLANDGNLPIYDHYIAGLQTDQANMRALGIAREIAAQEVVITGKVLGTQQLEVGQPITISGTGDFLVEGQTFVIVHSTYELNIGGEGFTQEFTAWKVDELQVSGIEGVASPQSNPYTTPVNPNVGVG